MVPDLEHDPSLARPEIEAKIEEHFRKVSADLPIWKRVRGLHFWTEDLPKTAKRSVKRRDVAAEIARLRKKTEETKGALAVASSDRGQVAWLLDTIATVSGRKRGDVQLGSRFGELGFDSLMYAELSSALESTGAVLPESIDITTLGTVAELQELLARGPVAAARERAASSASEEDREFHVPSPVSAAGKRGLALAQRLFYERVLETKVKGKDPHSPAHQLHRGRQPLFAPGHGRDQGRARRRRQGPGVDGGGRLLLPQPLPARLLQALHQPGADGAQRLDPQVDGHHARGPAARAQHGGLPGGDALGDRRAGGVSPQPRLSGAAGGGRRPPRAHRRQLRGAPQGDGDSAGARADRVVRAFPELRLADHA